MLLLTEPKAGLTPWLQAIAHAHARIDVNDYLLTDSPLIAALRQAAQRGVAVDVLIDGHPYDDTAAVSQTEAAFGGSRVQVKTAPARFEGSYAFDHAKYLVVDPGSPHAEALLGSPNGTASAFDGTNLEDAIETTSPTITQALAAVFQADWTGTSAGSMPRRSLVLSPEAQAALVSLLSGTGPVAVMTEELGDAPALYQALGHHGSQARVLVPSSLSSEDQGYARQLAQAGVQIRTLTSPYVHAKLIVTAQNTFVGSQNFSDVSLTDNREVGLITANATIHAQALAWFNAAWAQGTPWSGASSATGGSHSSSGGSGTPAAQSPTDSGHRPYLPKGDTMAQVTALWGHPTSIAHNVYHGIPQTVWHYAGGTVYLQQGRVTDVQRSS